MRSDTFSDGPHLHFHLNEYTSLLEVDNAVGFAQVQGQTNTAGALDYVRTEMFTSSNGDRNGKDHVKKYVCCSFATMSTQHFFYKNLGL